MKLKYLLMLVVLVIVICNDKLYAKNAQRIIALSPHAVELLFEIGAGDRIIGTVEYANYPQQAKNILRIGSYTGIQIEKLVELQPDLIVAWKEGNKLADLKKIESLGFNLVYSSPQNMKDIALDLIKLGELTGLQESASLAASNINKRYLKIKKTYANKEKVKVFYQLWHDPLRTAGAGSWVGSLIEDCNGKNLFDDASTLYPQVSLESVLIKDPQVIIIPHHKGQVGAKQGIWTNWQTIDAVKNRRVFTIDGDILLRPTSRSVEGLEALCAAIDSAR